jgi:hypothetical protein
MVGEGVNTPYPAQGAGLPYYRGPFEEGELDASQDVSSMLAVPANRAACEA